MLVSAAFALTVHLNACRHSAISAEVGARGVIGDYTAHHVIDAEGLLGLDPLRATELDTVRQHYNPIAQRLASLPKPVVAAVRGTAAGAGASLALLADFRIGGPKTTFLMAFANVGLAGDTGVSWSLPRIVGHARALELLLLAEPVRAPECQSLGLLSRLVDADEEVLPAAQELATRLAAGPTVAYGAITRSRARPRFNPRAGTPND